MAKHLDGKVAIVTGGGRGIGRGIALELGRQGAKVIVNDLGATVEGQSSDDSPAQEVVNQIRAESGTAEANYADVADHQQAEDLVRQALTTYQGLDILINVAGILRERMIFNMTEEEWDAVIAVHLKGAFNTTRLALPQMLKQGYGRVLLFSSGSGLGSTGQANYSAAKEGMVGFARALAREVGPYGVTVNAIYPGGNTRMTQSVPDAARTIRAAAGISRAGRAAEVQAVSDDGPTPRDPENNAPTVAWLCTEAGGAINGQVIGTSGWQASRYSQRHVARSIHRARPWTVEELARAIPNQLVNGITNPAPNQQPKSEE